MGIRIRTDDYPHRENVIDDAADLWDSNRTESIVKSCEHAVQSAEARREALMYLAGILPPEQLLEVAVRLSTSHLGITVEIQVDGVRNRSKVHPQIEVDPDRE